MATVREILKQSGLSDEAIDALDQKALDAFGGVLTTAESANVSAREAAAKAETERQAAIAERERVELERRSMNEFYEQKVVPGLTGWEQEKAALVAKAANDSALAAFYRTQNEGARGAGFVPTDAPGYVAPTEQPRNTQGQFVAGQPGSTPGSPTFLDATQVATRISDVAGSLTDLQWKYQTLYGQPLPIAPSQLIAEADAQKLSPSDYAARKFGFAARETEIAKQRQTDHENAIRAEEAAKYKVEYEAKEKAIRDEFNAKERARNEAGGNNPDVRVPPGASKFAEVARAVKAGERPDPLKMTDAQRRNATRSAIHSEIETQVA